MGNEGFEGGEIRLLNRSCLKGRSRSVQAYFLISYRWREKSIGEKDGEQRSL